MNCNHFLEPTHKVCKRGSQQFNSSATLIQDHLNFCTKFVSIEIIYNSLYNKTEKPNTYRCISMQRRTNGLSNDLIHWRSTDAKKKEICISAY